MSLIVSEAGPSHRSVGTRLRTRFPDVEFGRSVSVGLGVSIGAGTRIGSNVVIHADSSIGSNVRIDDGVVVGKLPMQAAASATTVAAHTPLPTVIGDHCILGTQAIVYRGATVEEGVLIADQASIREQVSIGKRTIIGRGVAVENRVTVGERCKIETGAYITAISSIGDYCFVGPCAVFTNDNYVGRTEARFARFRGVTMERGARVGANATVLPGLVIGADGLIAAGSVVTRDVPPGMLVMGCPARVVRPVDQEQLLDQQRWF